MALYGVLNRENREKECGITRSRLMASRYLLADMRPALAVVAKASAAATLIRCLPTGPSAISAASLIGVRL